MITNIDGSPRLIAACLQVAVDQRERNLARLKVMWGPDSAAVIQGMEEVEQIKKWVTSCIQQATKEPLRK